MVAVSASDVLYGLLHVRGGKYIQLIYNDWSMIQYRGRSHTNRKMSGRRPKTTNNALPFLWATFISMMLLTMFQGAGVTAEKMDTKSGQ